MLAACTKTAPTDNVVLVGPALVEKGQRVYQMNCTSCHNVNPSLDGSIGPAVAGSSAELLEARVLHAAYPAGYKAKRQSSLMVALPHLKNDLPRAARLFKLAFTALTLWI